MGGSVKMNVMAKRRCLWGGVICSCNLWCPVILLTCPLSMHVTQLITAHRWSVRREERSAQSLREIPKVCSAEASVDHGEAEGWRSKHARALNSDKGVQPLAQVKPITPGTAMQAGLRCSFFPLWSQCKAHWNSQPVSLLRTPGRRLHSQTHSLTQPLAAADWIVTVCTFGIRTAGGWADLWMQTFLSVHWRCRCWVGNLLKPERASLRWRFHLACHVSVCFLIYLCVSPRFPRGASTGLLPCYPGIDDQTRFFTGRRNTRHR